MPRGEGKSRRTSDLWNYFTLLDEKYATCNMCGNRMAYCSSSSNLRKHLTRKHSNYVNVLNSQTVQYVDLEYESEENIAEQEEITEEEVPSPTFKKPKLLITTNKTPKAVIKNLKANPKNADMIQEAISILSNVAHTNNTPDTEDDEFGQFGKYVTAQLRQLPLLNALEIQEKFYSILTRERINVMKNATELHSYGLNSHVPQHQCIHEQQSKQEEQQYKAQNQQKNQVVIELSEPLQQETEIYTTSDDLDNLIVNETVSS